MYDAIVVGARCADSPTAMLLARRGYRVQKFVLREQAVKILGLEEVAKTKTA
jgi:hypothetical protein